VRSGLGLTRKFAAVVLDWLYWTGSKIWHGLLVAFELTRKFGTGCWWHLELTRKSWTDSRSLHGLLVLEREASEKRGTSGSEEARCGVGTRHAAEGVEEGGEWGIVTRERSGVENTAASRQGVQECHLAPPGPSTCSSSSSQAILFVFFNCIMELP
jgi:hypothetical protein